MTPAQRATLEALRNFHDIQSRIGMPQDVDWHAERADVLRAALGTCATCAHADPMESQSGRVFCAAPPVDARFPFRYQAMPPGERCTGWTPRIDE